MENTVTKDQVKSALNVVLAVSEAIRDLGEVPNGHLYAKVMEVLSFVEVLAQLKTMGKKFQLGRVK